MILTGIKQSPICFCFFFRNFPLIMLLRVDLLDWGRIETRVIATATRSGLNTLIIDIKITYATVYILYKYLYFTYT